MRHLPCIVQYIYFVNLFAGKLLPYVICMFTKPLKKVKVSIPEILVLAIPDYFILRFSFLLYIYCENVEREINATRSLRYHLNVSAIFGVSYTDLEGLPSGILIYY